MPFGLKNAGAIYQQLIDKVFKDLIGNTIKVYVDDMVVKSRRAKDHPSALVKVFERLRAHNMWLNPEKYFFEVMAGKILGFMVTQRGIKANPDKCETILNIRSPTSLKEIQRLNGKLTALSRFLPKLIEKAKPLYMLLKGAQQFEWNNPCEEMFQELKQNIAALPILVSPLPRSTLYLYLVVSNSAVSSVLVYEEKKKQQPVYFTSRTLQPTEERYQIIEKLVLGLVFAARRL